MKIRLDLELPRTPPGSALAARERLGLPAGPIIMTGHQAEAWHPGIAAKFYAARAIAEAASASVAWLTPDHVPTEPWRLQAPALRKGRLIRRDLDLAKPNAARTPGSLLAPAPAPQAEWGGDEPALESVREGAERHARRLRERSGAASAAEQITGAMEAAVGPPGAPDAKAWASQLAVRGALGELLESIAQDPARCVASFNRAAGQHPEANVAKLRVLEGRCELPLWRLERGLRRRVFSDELTEIDRAELAPRALLMTAIARLDLCDLFIHGTGGAAYDRVMEAWIRDWLGEGVANRLAPLAMATADLRLPLDQLAPNDREIDAAAWRAHHARHDPALLGDEVNGKKKRGLLDQIRTAKEQGENAAPLFREMHALLERVRETHADQLAELDAAAAQAARLRGGAEIASDRAWPIVLHDQRAINELAERVAASARDQLRSPAPAPRG